MLQTTRRTLLNTAYLFTIGSLSGCGAITANKIGKVTTVTVNVAQIDAWSQAAENMTKLILSLPGINIPTPAVGAISLAGATITADIANWDKQTAGQTTYTVDTTNQSSIARTLLLDCQNVLNQTRTALGSTANQTTQSYINALAVIVSLFEAQLGVAPTAADQNTAPMSETDALKILRVR